MMPDALGQVRWRPHEVSKPDQFAGVVWPLEGDLMACIGEYIQSITIEQLSGTADAHGFVDNTDDTNWTEYVSSFALVQTKGGREFWKVDRVDADVSHVWLCPWSTTLAAALPSMRLIHEETTYEIVSVIDVDLAHEQIEIQTKRAV